MPTFGSLFAGIGGIDLGLERAGWECRFQVEWDEYCQHVLAHHWPDVPRFGDIAGVHGPLAYAHRFGLESERGGGLLDGLGSAQRDDADGCGSAGCLPRVDLLAGGFPCQPFSVAGRRRGMDDDRWLWPEFARLIGELRPRLVLVENVLGLLARHGGMGRVLGDLAALGYDAEWDSIPAAAVGAPHLRYRVWIVAHTNGALAQGRGVPSGVHAEYADADGRGGDAEWVLADLASWGRPRPGQPFDARHPAPRGIWQATEPVDGRIADQWRTEPDVGRVAHGVPSRVDRLRGLGNAVVPQVVEVIGRRLMEWQ